MIRRFAAPAVAVGIYLLGCTSANTGSTAGAMSEADGGEGATAPGGSDASQVDTGNAPETSGPSEGVGDAMSAGDDTSSDASAIDEGMPGGDSALPEEASLADGSLPDGASADASVGAGLPTVTGKPWNYICEKTWSHEQCCALLCACLKQACADSPMDKPGTDACMTTCPKLTDMAMRCHVFHCSESTNPTNPKDHVSHCGHASGRVAGGMCPTEVYQ